MTEQWDRAVGDVQREVASLSRYSEDLLAHLSDLLDTANRLDRAVLSHDDYTMSNRSHDLLDTTQRGVTDIRDRLNDASTAAIQLRRSLDFYLT